MNICQSPKHKNQRKHKNNIKRKTKSNLIQGQSPRILDHCNMTGRPRNMMLRNTTVC